MGLARKETSRVVAVRPVLGRCAVLLAVVLQAGGQVAYGTWLTEIPSPLFVFGTFVVATTFFLVVSGRGTTAGAWKPLLVLNAATTMSFLSFFYALKVIEPAIASAILVGVGPVFAVLLALAHAGTRPSAARIAICGGILVGGAILAIAASNGTGAGQSVALSGIAASVATGLGAVLITVASRALLDRGWKSGAVLAHRFYMILPVSLVLALVADPGAIAWTTGLASTFFLVATLGVVGPLYLLLVGIRHTDPWTVVVTMAAMPLVTFAMQGLSPAYAWTWLTAAGLAIITAFIIVDAWTARGRRMAG
jgi:drug/metabolite transporter (DMT)-like permease